VVIRHWPQRDADNTWRTWIIAICGAAHGGHDHWATGAPLVGWRPTAIASADRPKHQGPGSLRTVDAALARPSSARSCLNARGLCYQERVLCEF
jgi:hypothetical protein